MRVRANELLQNGYCNVSLTYGTQRTGYGVPLIGKTVTFPLSELNDSEITYFLRENGDLLGNPEYILSGLIDNGEVFLKVARKFARKEDAVREARSKKVYEVLDLKNEITIYL